MFVTEVFCGKPYQSYIPAPIRSTHGNFGTHDDAGPPRRRAAARDHLIIRKINWLRQKIRLCNVNRWLSIVPLRDVQLVQSVKSAVTARAISFPMEHGFRIEQ
jgi:hypothetical protein